jgi:hypothetical protein
MNFVRSCAVRDIPVPRATVVARDTWGTLAATLGSRTATAGRKVLRP